MEQVFRVDDVVAGAVRNNFPFFDHHGAVRYPQGVLRGVGRFNKCVSFTREFDDLIEKLKLVAVVEAAGRFVHDECICALGQRPGDERKLALTPADFRIGPRRQMEDGKPLQCVFGNFHVFV